MSTTRVATARAIETSADGKAPHAVRLWRFGPNKTDKGTLKFTERSAKLVMQAYSERGNPLVFDYEHESLVPLNERGGTPMKGVASADRANLEVRPGDDGKPELWAVDIAWTDEARRQIESRERTQISPVSNFDTKTREIFEIVNVALCREGATHFGTLLATADKGASHANGARMDLIDQIVEALEAGDFEKAENLVNEMEASESEADKAMSAKMGKMVKAAKACGAKAVAKPVEGEPPPESAPPAKAANASSVALSRAIGEANAARDAMLAATRESKRGSVEMVIALNRECFDAADEREHIAAANPDATRKHVASMKRKIAAGTLAASRPAPTEAKPPKDAEVADSHGLTPHEIEAAARDGIALKDYAASKARHASSGRRAGAGKVN